MAQTFMQEISALLEGKTVSNPITIFSLNILLDNDEVISVSTLDKTLKISDKPELGDTTAHMTSKQLRLALDGGYDMQQMYLNGQIQVEGSVMDLMRFRNFLK